MATPRKTQPEKTEPEPITLQFAAEKETPNTVRYAEIVADNDVARVKTLYIQKATAEELGFPEVITVTIEASR